MRLPPEESLVALVFILSRGGVLWCTIPNRHILINAITINEAKEVVDYRSAIWRGYEIIKEKGYNLLIY